MRIKILSVSVEKVATAKGGYEKLEVAYKDDAGKVGGKNLVSFDNPPIFNAAKALQAGDTVDVTSEKIDNYWKWTSINKAGEGSPEPTAQAQTGVQTASKAPVKSTYETPEERAAKQVYIVRQSSITAALTYVGDTKKVSVGDVIEVAKQFEAYVFSGNNKAEVVEGEDDIV